MIKKIYLAGGMSGLTWEEMTEWRRKARRAFKNITDGKIDVVSPTDHIPHRKPNSTDLVFDKEIMQFDIYGIRTSDLIIMNFNIPASIGTAIELGIAYENKIPVIGLNEKNTTLHPWQQEMCMRIFNDFDDLFIYVVEHFIATVE